MKTTRIQSLSAIVLLVSLASMFSIAQALPLDCGNLNNAYGPFDYTNGEHFIEKLPIVEEGHFNSDVETLTSGLSGTIMGDLDYTLRAFPNHHRALNAMGKYKLQKKQDIEEYLSAECYFARAIAFKPEDGVVYQIYAIYLHKSGKVAEAEKQYFTALRFQPESSEIHYNLGLLYYDKSNYQLALDHAQKAYALNYPLEGLKRLLIRKGVWK